MKRLTVNSLYLVDSVLKRTIRRRDSTVFPYTMVIAIDTTDEVTEEHMRYAYDNGCVECVRYTTLFGDYSTTLRFKFGPFFQEDVKSEFEKLKNIAYNDLELLLLARSENPILLQWTKLFIYLFSI